MFNNRRNSAFNLHEPRVRINVPPRRRQYWKMVINNVFQRPFRYFIRSVYTIINKLRNEEIPARTTVSQELSYRTEESFNPEVELANFSNLNIREVIKIGDGPAIAGPSNFEMREPRHHLRTPRQIPLPLEIEEEPEEDSFLSYMNRMRHVARWVATTVDSPWSYDEFTEPVKHYPTCDCCLILSYGNFIPSEAGADDHFPCC